MGPDFVDHDPVTMPEHQPSVAQKSPVSRPVQAFASCEGEGEPGRRLMCRIHPVSEQEEATACKWQATMRSTSSTDIPLMPILFFWEDGTRIKSVRRQQQITGVGQRLVHHSTREPHHQRLGAPGQGRTTRKSSQPRTPTWNAICVTTPHQPSP